MIVGTGETDQVQISIFFPVGGEWVQIPGRIGWRDGFGKVWFFVLVVVGWEIN